MNKLNLQHPLAYQTKDKSVVSTLPPVSLNPSVGNHRRLIVLVPAEADYSTAMHRIWELARAFECQILFLSLCSDEAQEASLRRKLVTLCAMAQDGRTRAQGRVEVGSNWVSIAESNVEDGDMIVCFAEHRAGLLHRPLNQILESNMDTPVYILSGFYPRVPTPSSWLSKIAGWIGSIGIIVGAFLLQIQIMTMIGDPVQTILLIGSVIAEFWVIWIWNRSFS